MNVNQNNIIQKKDEVDVREIIGVLWKNKIMIMSFSLIFAILTGIISVLVISPVYDTKLNIVISMPEIYITRYGEYTLPITTNQQYIDLIKSNNVLINTIKDMEYNTDDISLEDLQKSISIKEIGAKVEDMNSFEIIVSADNPVESLKLAQTIYDNYLDFMDAMTKERIVNYFYNNFAVDIKSLEYSLNKEQDALKKNEELLAETPKAFAGNANLEIKTQLNEASDYVVPVDTINPNYIKIENDIIVNKQTINDIVNSIRMNKKYLEELDVEKAAINSYYRTGESEKLESSVIGIIETYVYLPSPPVAPTQKTSPSNLYNIVIGTVIGITIGVLVVLIKEYWLNEAK